MKIGYPAINTEIGCKSSATFRLKNYSPKRFIETVRDNLECLESILHYNSMNGFYFFRISSDILPFASHSIQTVKWELIFKSTLESIGAYINEKGIRISMHPDQFILINALDERIVNNSIAELEWHCALLDAMNLDKRAKVQIHVGGVYNDKDMSITRFIERYELLSPAIRSRLAIENDHRLYSLSDCMRIHEACKIPVIFDSFHHECLNNGESLREGLKMARKTWDVKDGVLMTDYSSQKPNEKKGMHAETLDKEAFRKYLIESKGIDFDIMLEIKDKQVSASKALQIAREVGKI